MINQVLMLVLVGLSDPPKLSLFVGTGYLAVSFDLGYGLLSTRVGKQGRWWLVPSAAVVIPAGPVTFDIGAG